MLSLSEDLRQHASLAFYRARPQVSLASGHNPYRRIAILTGTMNTPGLALMQQSLVGPPDADIVALEARLRAAQIAADVPALDALISEELLFTGPDGQLGSKAEDLSAHGSGAVRFRTHEPEELRVRRIGEAVAVSALRARLVVEVGGTLVQGTYRYTRVWALEADGGWRVVGGHVSAVPPAAPSDVAAPAP